MEFECRFNDHWSQETEKSTLFYCISLILSIQVNKILFSCVYEKQKTKRYLAS